MSFAELAAERGLASASACVGELEWNIDADPALTASPSTVDGVLAAMPRRGLEPALATRLLDLVPARPLERALLAWDIARGSLLWRPDTELLARLSTELTPLKQIGVTARDVAVSRDRIAQLVDALPSNTDALDDYLTLPSLEGLVAISRALTSLDDKPQLVAVTLDHAKRLSFAHLPSLALAFLQILWDRFAVQWALDLMIEIALDFRQLDAVPQVEPRDEHSMQQKAYGLLRAHLALHDIAGAVAVDGSLSRSPAIDPALLVARAELALRQAMPIDAETLAIVNAIAPPDSGWRYAVFVRESLALRADPSRADEVIARYTSRFGNSAELWSAAARHAPARGDLLKRLSHEVRYLSHDPEVWRALAVFSVDADALHADVQRRLRTQLAGAVA